MKSKDRVQAHTAAHVNSEIERQATRRILHAAGEPKSAITRRITCLDGEWDFERWLEANAAALAFTGTCAIYRLLILAKQLHC